MQEKYSIKKIKERKRNIEKAGLTEKRINRSVFVSNSINFK